MYCKKNGHQWFRFSIHFISNRIIFKMSRSKKKKISVINTSLWAVINKKVITRNALCQPQVWIVLGKKKKKKVWP